MTVIKVLGSGCANCERLYAATSEAVGRLGIDAQVEKVTDIAEIVSAGVMTTPALSIDGDVVLAGRVPASDELDALLTRATGGGADPAASGGCGCGSGCC